MPHAAAENQFDKKKGQNTSLNLSSEKTPLVFEHGCFYSIYLFVGTSRHVGTHVEMPRRVDKHDLESAVELSQCWLQRKEKKKTRQ